MRLFALLTPLLLVFGAGISYGQCEPTRLVRETLERYSLRHDSGSSKVDRDARRAAILEEGLAKFPGDYFLFRRDLRSRQLDAPREQLIEHYRLLYTGHPRDPVYAAICALALTGRDTHEAIRILEKTKANHADFPRTYLQLAEIFSYGKFKDTTRVGQELSAYLKICPAPLDPDALHFLVRNGSTEQLAKTAAAVRKRLQSRSDPLLASIWEALWDLEFRAQPPAEHSAVRKQIAQDAARFEQSPHRHELDWLTFLRTGYENLNDQAAVNRLNKEILKEYPASDVAQRIATDQWAKAHPFPMDRGDKAAVQAFYRASLAAVDEWLKTWPQDSVLIARRFDALAALEDTTAEQIGQAADQLLPAFKRDANWRRKPPLESQIAEAYLKHKMRLDQIPGLIEEGYRTALKNEERNLDSDQLPDDMRTFLQEQIDWLRLGRARILLDYYSATGQTANARIIEDELTDLNPEKPGMKSTLLARRAQAAELQGRKLDALMLYRAAMEIRGKNMPALDMNDPLAEHVARLWKELGGTPGPYATFLNRTTPTEATDSRWEKPKNPLPDFSLTDLEGKRWRLIDLKGKATLINVWATWCTPCRLEHPEFQKLYEKLKGRQDVAVLSFNVDDEVGKVAAYMKENKYTFPAIPARAVVDAVSPVLSVPQIWFITPTGKLEWEQIGFGSDPKWQETMTAKLDELLKAHTK